MLRAAVALAFFTGLPCAAAPGDWTMAAGDHANTRFSALAQVSPANVARLAPAFTFDTGVQQGQEGAPIVANGTMYLLSPYPNYLYALDLRNGDAKKWTFDPHAAPGAQGVACCGVAARGIAYDNGRVFMVTLDGQAIAVDADRGTELWRTRLADVARGETVTMAPLVVGGKLLVGNSGAALGVRGWLAALDTATGKQAWRAWSTGPDSDVLIGADFNPHYGQDRGRDLGVATWPTDGWRTGGGSVSGWLSYDADAGLVYYGTDSPAPGNAEQRPGANKWTAGIFARDPATGQARWFYQYSPHDLHGYDGSNENVLADLAIGGQSRKVLLHPDANGYLYVLDRLTGQVLSADPFVRVTTSNGIAPATGALRYDAKHEPRVGEARRLICPSAAGAKNRQPSAWSPLTRLLYIPHQNLCQDSSTYDTAYIAGTPYGGVDSKMYAAPEQTRGAFTAWDPVARKARWSVPERFPVWSGALATAGGVVFYGTMDGWFKAVDARDGKALWRFRVDSGIVASR